MQSLIDKIEATPSWSEQLEKQQIFSQPEMKRVEFLLALLSYFEMHPEEWIKIQSSTHEDLITITAKISAATAAFFDADQTTIPESARALRENLLSIEEKLSRLREQENVQMDNHLQVGKHILDTRNKIGLALGGGGLWGLAHAGVLEVLQREGIPIHMIAGASMGALVGGVASAFIDENHQLTPDGIDYIQHVAVTIRTLSTLSEKRDGKVVLPLDKLLNPANEDGFYEQLMTKPPAVSYWAQVQKQKPTKNEIFLTPQPGDSLGGVMKIAAASAALKPKFGLDPVEIDGILYADDKSVARKSTSAAVKQLRENGASTVIGAPVGFIDSDVLAPLKWIQDRLSPNLRDRGDVVITSKDGRGILSGTRSLTNFGKGLPVVGKKYAQTETDILSGKKIPIPVLEFIAAGKEAANKALPEIYRALGLRPLSAHFEK